MEQTLIVSFFVLSTEDKIGGDTLTIGNSDFINKILKVLRYEGLK